MKSDPELRYVRYCEVNPAWASRDMSKLKEEVKGLEEELATLKLKTEALEEELAIYKQLVANALC